MNYWKWTEAPLKVIEEGGSYFHERFSTTSSNEGSNLKWTEIILFHFSNAFGAVLQFSEECIQQVSEFMCFIYELMHQEPNISHN